jgi:hypothetical protein
MLGLAAPAHAAVGSTITSPGNPAELFYNGDTGSGSVTVRGFVAGWSRNAQGDLLCYTVSDSHYTTVATGITVSSGTFATVASLKPIAGAACRLALVPSGRTPTGTAAAAFAGPAVSVSNQFSHVTGGNLYSYYILSGTLSWSFAFGSLGDCAIQSSYATEPATLGSFALFTGNACLPANGLPGVGSRSALQVDGLNAYPPAALSALAEQPGFEPLSYSASYDANHDTVNISETEVPTVCDVSATVPPTTSSCPTLYDSGIRVQQVTELLPGGQVARVRQVFTSVDGRPHNLDLLFSQSVTAPTSGETPGFEFPGQSAASSQAKPDSFSAFGPGPSSIVVVGNVDGFLPAVSNPIGAITFARPPASVNFVSAKRAQTATMLMHYVASVPAGGSVAYDWSFSQASTAATLIGLERTERDRFSPPSVSITSPRNPATVRRSQLTLRGVASDAVGLTALRVAGQGVAVNAAGAWSASVALRAGRNVISATAVNDAGRSSTSSVTVTYRPSCAVPRLRGATVRSARRSLSRSLCRVGGVMSASSRQIRRGRIISTRPRAGSLRQRGARVELVVSRGR